MRDYYNENDPYAAQWLRNLIAAGLIPGGKIDDRSIKEVRSADLAGFGQAHFFAGIAGWSLALRLAGWPADREVWTGSCPCQPFSSAGKRRGTDDERHLWPVWRELIRECRPATIFGEQVGSADGRAWLSRVRVDLEEMGYAVGAADLCAASVGVPHIRQRLWWVANAEIPRRWADTRTIRESETPRVREAQRKDTGRSEQQARRTGDCGSTCGLADTEDSDRGAAADTEDTGRRTSEIGGCGGNGRLANSDVRTGQRGKPQPSKREVSAEDAGNSWVVYCLDGKTRRVEPGVFPLAHGVPNRVGKLRAYGNAIVPQVAAEFIMAFMECKTPNDAK